MHVLLIEDDHSLSSHLAKSLSSEGMSVNVIGNAEDLSKKTPLEKMVDVIVMDRMLGDFDTKNYIANIRAKYPSSALIILSAIDTPHERTDLLNLGADDYIGKPFSTDELVARVKAITRRLRTPSEPATTIGNLSIDLINRVANVNGESIVLSAKEFLLLRTLSKEVKKVWSKSELLTEIWSDNEDPDSNVVEMTVANLRKKLTSIGASVSIKNMRFVGYWLEA